jgi:predicted DCC family thiol-disulfide oxidoreductase YuxK
VGRGHRLSLGRQSAGKADIVEAVFIFDGECGFCRKWAGWLQHRVGTTARFVPFQAVDLAEFGLTVQDVQEASYLYENGHAYGGGRGFARALRRGRSIWRLVGIVLGAPGDRVVTDNAYRAIARNRHRLPAPHGDVNT